MPSPLNNYYPILPESNLDDQNYVLTYASIPYLVPNEFIFYNKQGDAYVNVEIAPETWKSFNVCKKDHWDRLHSLCYVDENNITQDLPRGSQLIFIQNDLSWVFNDRGKARKVIYKYNYDYPQKKISDSLTSKLKPDLKPLVFQQQQSSHYQPPIEYQNQQQSRSPYQPPHLEYQKQQQRYSDYQQNLMLQQQSRSQYQPPHLEYQKQQQRYSDYQQNLMLQQQSGSQYQPPHLEYQKQQQLASPYQPPHLEYQKQQQRYSDYQQNLMFQQQSGSQYQPPHLEYQKQQQLASPYQPPHLEYQKQQQRQSDQQVRELPQQPEIKFTMFPPNSTKQRKRKEKFKTKLEPNNLSGSELEEWRNKNIFVYLDEIDEEKFKTIPPNTVIFKEGNKNIYRGTQVITLGERQAILQKRKELLQVYQQNPQKFTTKTPPSDLSDNAKKIWEYIFTYYLNDGSLKKIPTNEEIIQIGNKFFLNDKEIIRQGEIKPLANIYNKFITEFSPNLTGEFLNEQDLQNWESKNNYYKLKNGVYEHVRPNETIYEINTETGSRFYHNGDEVKRNDKLPENINKRKLEFENDQQLSSEKKQKM